MIQQEKVRMAGRRIRVASELLEKLARFNWELAGPKVLEAICGLVLVGLLTAGLWPFHSPRNDVTWVEGGNGLHIRRHGTVLSSGKFKPEPAPSDAPCSLELWFEPDFTAGGGTLLAFYDPENR